MNSIPGKTFFLGEYLALLGGPAIIGLTQPCFQKDVERSLHPECMAARFWQKETGSPCDWGLSDPYMSRGGLGASTAEFLLAYQEIYGGFDNLDELRQTYWQYADQKCKPSAYDLLAQTSEACVVFESAHTPIHSVPWGFADLDFILVHTQKKLATHEHLEHFNRDFAWQKLSKIVERGLIAWESWDADVCIAAINACRQELDRLNLLAQHSQAWIEHYSQKLPILGAKGCGAMGSDVILLVLDKKDSLRVLDKLQQDGQLILATAKDLYQN